MLLEHSTLQALCREQRVVSVCFSLAPETCSTAIFRAAPLPRAAVGATWCWNLSWLRGCYCLRGLQESAMMQDNGLGAYWLLAQNRKVQFTKLSFHNFCKLGMWARLSWGFGIIVSTGPQDRDYINLQAWWLWSSCTWSLAGFSSWQAIGLGAWVFFWLLTRNQLLIAHYVCISVGPLTTWPLLHHREWTRRGS